jgi:hypothetical protein
MSSRTCSDPIQMITSRPAWGQASVCIKWPWFTYGRIRGLPRQHTIASVALWLACCSSVTSVPCTADGCGEVLEPPTVCD